MKKTFLIFVSIALLVTSAACNGNSLRTVENALPESQTISDEPSLNEKEIIPQQASQTPELVGQSQPEPDSVKTVSARPQIRVQTENGNPIVFELNDSHAAEDLFRQLPLTLPVENFSTNEKIFYPPEKLDVSDAPPAQGNPGDLVYYAPWGNVVMFYDEFGPSGDLYGLGQVVSGAEWIKELSGSISVEGIEP